MAGPAVNLAAAARGRPSLAARTMRPGNRRGRCVAFPAARSMSPTLSANQLANQFTGDSRMNLENHRKNGLQASFCGF
jgi:hypothetical protein